MKKVIFISLFFAWLAVMSQGWQNKTITRIQSSGSSLKVVFTDSSYAYIQKTRVLYFVDMPNSVFVQMGYCFDGSTQRTISFPYNSITQPTSTSPKDLTSKLNDLLQ